MKKVIEYMRPSFSLLFLGVTIKFIGALMDLFLPWVLSHLIDHNLSQSLSIMIVSTYTVLPTIITRYILLDKKVVRGNHA